MKRAVLFNPESQPLTLVGQRQDVSPAACPEMEILSYADQNRPEVLSKYLSAEILGSKCSESLIEPDHYRVVDPEVLHQVKLVFPRCQDARELVRDDLPRVAVECQDDRRHPAFLRPAHTGIDNRLVSLVNTVENPYGDDTGTGVLHELFCVLKQLHLFL